MAIADMVGLPYETTRRYVQRLVAKGQCLRVAKGLIVPAATIDGPGRRDMVRANLINLKRLHRGLAAHGVGLGDPRRAPSDRRPTH